MILGAGPAGLTAGYLLAKLGRRVLVLEAEDQVGGLSKTVVRDGYRFDLGGHRFFTKSPEVESLWLEVLGEELLLRPRLSRSTGTGASSTTRSRCATSCASWGRSSWAAASLRTSRPCRGRRTGAEPGGVGVPPLRQGRLYDLFFRTYTEKVWGVPGSEIRAEWAAQRIKGLSLRTAAKDALLGGRGGGVKSLIREFHYLRYGPGQMWEVMAERIEDLGGEVVNGAPVERIHVEDGRVAAVEAGSETIPCADAISSLPLRALAEIVAGAAAGGARRGPRTRVPRLPHGCARPPGRRPLPRQLDLRARSLGAGGAHPELPLLEPLDIPEAGRTCVGLEYFCFEGDDLWDSGDDRLVELAAGELTRLGLADGSQAVRSYVERVPKAYPVYDADYAERLATVRRWVDDLDGLQQVGRNGLHRYNNSDHSMLTAIRAVDNLVTGAGTTSGR